MKQYKTVNNLVGWITFLIAATVYCMTIEPTASFWDCPEFITTGYKLEVGHPPGAPFFMLVANLFSQFASDASTVAKMVNYMSALMSGACILFLFWSITHLVRKLVVTDENNITRGQMVTIMGSGLVGALAYTFSDTFWFSAVEGEVYAFSSLFTAVVFWLILKWEDVANEPHSDRWLILIAYLTGLSIGVHLLNLLCLPAIVLVYYYKKVPNANARGSLLALLASGILVAAVLYGIVPGIVKVGGWFELLFVNGLGMPFNTGVVVYIILLAAALIWGVYESYTQKSKARMAVSFILTIALLGIPFYGHGASSILIGILVIGVLAIYLAPQMQEKMKEYQNALDDMSNEAVEYVRGIPVVKTFGQTIFSFKKFKDSIDRYKVWVIAYTKQLRTPMMFYTAAINGVFATLIAGGLLLTQDGVTSGFLLDLIFYIIITPVISVTLTRIMFQSENAMIVDDALQRIDSVLHLKPLEETKHSKHPQNASVELKSVHFSYDGEKEVLKDISLTIPAGQTVAFVGPSGGGKTTLANLISRFFDPQSGMVKIGGVNVKDIPKEELMNTVSFVFQNSRLIKASILENVRMGKPEATREEVLTALHHAQCDDILEKLPQGVDTVIGTKGVYLSGGEQQRIAIARVMLKNAPIIILDEATAFADPDNESRVQAAFSKLSEGKTVIMIAHRLSTVTNVDQIFVIQDGRVAECGNSRELLAKDGIFSRMWKNYQTSVQWKVTKEVQ